MNRPYTIQNELKDINSTLPSDKTESYTVPDGYFEGLAATVLSKIKQAQPESADKEVETLSPLLAAIPRQVPFSVPDNYFNQNIEDLTYFIRQDLLPPFLAQHDRQMPFQVPDGYFENLPKQVVSRITKTRKAKVVSFSTQKWMRYASAAVVIGIIALSIFYFQGNKSSVDPVKQPHEWVAKKLQNVSNQDLDKFINITDIDISTNSQQIAKKSSPNTEVRKMLGNVSTSELDAFLNEVPSETDESSIN